MLACEFNEEDASNFSPTRWKYSTSTAFDLLPHRENEAVCSLV